MTENINKMNMVVPEAGHFPIVGRSSLFMPRMNMQVWLTQRDRLLMDALYQNVVLSFPQVWQKFFPQKAKSTALNRLAKLEKAGFVKRIRIPRLNDKHTEPDIKVVFQITRRGIRELEKWQPDLKLRTEPVRINGWSVGHDVLLVEVLDVLKKRFPNATIMDGRLWNKKRAEPAIWPDAFLTMKNSEKPWAIELELTAKSAKRYWEIVFRYRITKEFEKVLYIISSEKILEKLQEKFSGKLTKLENADPSARFLYTELTSLLPSGNGESRLNHQQQLGGEIHDK